MELFGKTFQVAEITEYVAPITELAAGGFLDKVHKRIGQNGQFSVGGVFESIDLYPRLLFL